MNEISRGTRNRIKKLLILRYFFPFFRTLHACLTLQLYRFSCQSRAKRKNDNNYCLIYYSIILIGYFLIGFSMFHVSNQNPNHILQIMKQNVIVIISSELDRGFTVVINHRFCHGV